MSYTCDCGRVFSDLRGLELCQSTKHGKAAGQENVEHTAELVKLALNLISLGEHTRGLQKVYYKTRNQTNLVAAKEAERKFDELLSWSKMQLDSIQAELEGKHFQAELPIEKPDPFIEHLKNSVRKARQSGGPGSQAA